MLYLAFQNIVLKVLETKFSEYDLGTHSRNNTYDESIFPREIPKKAESILGKKRDSGLISVRASCGKVRTDKLTSTLHTIAKSV